MSIKYQASIGGSPPPPATSGSASKESIGNVGDLGWKDHLDKGKTTTPVFWPGEFHGLYSPWGGKESDKTERVSLSSLSFFKLVPWKIDTTEHS